MRCADGFAAALVRTALLSALLPLLLCGAAARAEGRQVAAPASSGEHLWLAAPWSGERATHRWQLWHAVAEEPAVARAAAPLSEMPEAIAASGDRVLLLFPPRSAILPQHYVLSLRTQRNPATALWFNVPADRMELLPPLPGPDAETESFAAISAGPLLLRVGSAALLQLEHDAWVAHPLPPPLDSATKRRLEVQGDAWSILATTAEDGAWERWRPADGTWTRVPLGVPGAAEVTPVTGAGRSLVVVADGHGRSLEDQAEQPPRTIVESLPPEGTVVWFGTEPKLANAAPDGVVLQSIDRVSGAIGGPQTLAAQRSIAGVWLHLPVLLGVAMAALGVAFVARALREGRPLALPPGWVPAPIMLRVVALAIDLAPAAALSLWLWDVRPVALLLLPSYTPDAAAFLPSLTAITLSVLISGTCEAIWGRSLGKRLTGLRVVSARQGTPPTLRAWQSVARNVFKLIVLDMPILGAFTLLSATGQGVSEIVSGTAVAVPAPPGAAAGPSSGRA